MHGLHIHDRKYSAHGMKGAMDDEVVSVSPQRRKAVKVERMRACRARRSNRSPSTAAFRVMDRSAGRRCRSRSAAAGVMSKERARALNLEPLAEIVAHGMSADRYAWLHTVPALALSNALKKAGLEPADLDLVEVNEAFAAVALNATRMLELDEDKVNVNGGAVAIGHPIGASGARLVLTVAHELKRRGLTLGASTLCGGGGQGDALIVRGRVIIWHVKAAEWQDAPALEPVSERAWRFESSRRHDAGAVRRSRVPFLPAR